MADLSLIIPCYNEAPNIHFLLKRLSDVILSSDADIEVVLVDNGSTDETYDIFLSLLKDYSFIKPYRIPVNKGYGYGILEGLSIATGEVLAWTHADLQADPWDVISAYKIYQENKSKDVVVKGKRFGRGVLDNVCTYGMQLLASWLLGISLNDINAQPKLFSNIFFKKFIQNKAPNDFSLDLFVLYAARINQYKILTTPVQFRDRIYGEAKGGGANIITRLKIISRTIAYILAVRTNASGATDVNY